MRPRAWTYDMWGVGVVWLELIMATPQVGGPASIVPGSSLLTHLLEGNPDPVW